MLSAVVKARVLSYHSIIRFLHWLKISDDIEYKLLSLTYEVLTTTQPPYLHKHNLICHLCSASSQQSLFISCCCLLGSMDGKFAAKNMFR